MRSFSTTSVQSSRPKCRVRVNAPRRPSTIRRSPAFSGAHIPRPSKSTAGHAVRTVQSFARSEGRQTMGAGNNFGHGFGLQRRRLSRWASDSPEPGRDGVGGSSHNPHWITAKTRARREQYKAHTAETPPRSIRNTTHADRQLI